MTIYSDIKLLHVVFAAASILLFILRGVFSVLASRPLPGRIWKILPHAVDTLLLGFGIWLTVLLRLNPVHVPWLGIKLICVILYIVLGILAFRLKRPHWLRVVVFVAAILLFGFIVSVAVLHTPLGLISYL